MVPTRTVHRPARSDTRTAHPGSVTLPRTHPLPRLQASRLTSRPPL
jgi:hypothetical protein